MKIEEFTTHLRARDASPRTIEAYREDLRILFPDGITTRAALEQSLANAEEKGASNATRARRLSGARAYFRWCRENGDETPDPTVGMRMRRKSDFVPAFMTKAETTRFLKTILKSGSDNTARDFAIMSLMVWRGLRVSEVAGLDIADFIYEAQPGEIMVMQKGGRKVRMVIGDDVASAIRCYLLRRDADEENDPNAPVGGALFLGVGWRRISVSQIQGRVKHWTRKAGIKKPLTPHSLRHTFATTLLRETGNIRLVQEALGHADISTTARYAHVTDGDLAKALGAKNE